MNSFAAKLFICPDAKATFALGQSIGRACRPGQVVLLSGQLGAGKTVLAKGMALGLGVDPAYDIVSPTFTLLNDYPGKCPFFHADLYRLEQSEVEEMAMLEQATFGVLAVEWPERAYGLWPPEAIIVSLAIKEDHTREVQLQADDRFLAAIDF